MRVSALLLTASLAGAMGAGTGSSHAAGDDAADWQMFGRVLALVKSVVGSAARSDDPRAVERGIEHALAGGNAEVNRLAVELMHEALSDMPAQHRQTIVSLARDIASLARRQSALAAPPSPFGALPSRTSERALAARRELTSMGLSYYDARQFLDAVRRDDELAVELYVAGRGVNLEARDADGASALDIARRRGNRQIAALLAAAQAR